MRGALGLGAALTTLGLALLLHRLAGEAVAAGWRSGSGAPWQGALPFLLSGLATGLALLPVPGVAASLRGELRWSGLGRAGPNHALGLAVAAVSLSQLAQMLWHGRQAVEAASFNRALLAAATGDQARWLWTGLMMGSAVILAPLAEELLFRGVLFRSLRARIGFWGGALISSACFAGMHEPSVFLPIFTLALVCCWLYEQHGSLLAPVLLHGANNLAATALLLIAAGAA